jgi:hypothetical protein
MKKDDLEKMSLMYKNTILNEVHYHPNFIAMGIPTNLEISPEDKERINKLLTSFHKLLRGVTLPAGIYFADISTGKPISTPDSPITSEMVETILYYFVFEQLGIGSSKLDSYSLEEASEVLYRNMENTIKIAMGEKIEDDDEY